MQTTTLPIQVSGAGPANAPQRPNQTSDAEQFGATLAREMEQRRPQQAAAPAPQPQPAKAREAQDDGAKAADAQPPAQAQSQDDAPPASAASTADPAKPHAADSASGARDKDEDKDHTQAAAQPAADMLALIAGFSQLHQAGGATAATPRAALPGAAAGAVKGQAALQAALKAVGKDDAAAQAGADTRGLPLAQANDALAGAAHQGSAEGIDLRAASSAAMLKTPAAAGDAAAKLPEFAAKLEALQQAPTAAMAAPPQLQAAALAAAQPAAAAADRLGARVGTSAWDSQLGQKIVWMAGSGEQTASLTLNPPDLGPLQVVLSVTGDQASVAFSASQQEVRHALESSLPRLREMMGESGIALGNATVSAGMPDQRQAQGDNHPGGTPRGAAGTPGGAAGTGVDSVAPAVLRTTVLGDGMVDTFV
jgi:flagellar hook-length control protein FliK